VGESRHPQGKSRAGGGVPLQSGLATLEEQEIHSRPKGRAALTRKAWSQSHRLMEAMVLNLNKSSEALRPPDHKRRHNQVQPYRDWRQISCPCCPLDCPKFETDGTPGPKCFFTSKLTELEDPMGQSTWYIRKPGWGGRSATKSAQFLARGYLAPNMNQEPDGLTSLRLCPTMNGTSSRTSQQLHRDRQHASSVRQFRAKDSIQRYTKKQFFLPNRIEDWSTSKLIATARFIDLLTCEDGIASEAYRTAQDLYEQNRQTFRGRVWAVACKSRFSIFLNRVFQGSRQTWNQFT
jgi:hypothetical protein